MPKNALKKFQHKGFITPPIPPPDDFVYFCVPCPNEPQHIENFLGAVQTLTLWTNYKRTADKRGKQIADIWRDIFIDMTYSEENCMACCDDTNDLLAQMLKIMQNGFTVVPSEAKSLPPDIFGGACAPAFFDHDEDEVDSEVLLQRQKALCITAERYVKGVLLAGLLDMGAPSALTDYIDSQLPHTIPATFSKLQVVYPSIFSGLSAFFAALTGGAELPLIACQMVIALGGDTNNTFANFRASVDASLLEALLIPLAGMVQASNGLMKNYQIFNVALHDANEEDLSAYHCPCGIQENCDETLELVPNPTDANVNMTVITPYEHELGNVFHIVQNTYQSPENSNRYIASVTDALGRCLRFGQVSGLTQVPIAASYRLGCLDGVGDCESETLFGGGAVAFAPCTAKELAWQSETPIDTYLRVICCVPEE